jgi:hypothetical protein
MSMSEPAPAPPDQATAEAIAAAVARAERRLWLLEIMTRFCMALLRALKPGGAAGDLMVLAQVKALVVISRAGLLCIGLKLETERLLRDLKAGVLPASGPARPPASTEAAETPEKEDREAIETLDREDFRERAESDTAFRARFEAFEALLDPAAGGPDWSADETVRRLCRVLGLEPEWSRWLGDEWIEENLELKRLLAFSAPVGESIVEAAERSPRRARTFLASVSGSALFADPPPPAGKVAAPQCHALE